ncbi:unnamed protein product [Ectocarpus sp. 12 AP-2014]
MLIHNAGGVGTARNKSHNMHHPDHRRAWDTHTQGQSFLIIPLSILCIIMIMKSDPVFCSYYHTPCTPYMVKYYISRFPPPPLLIDLLQKQTLPPSQKYILFVPSSSSPPRPPFSNITSVLKQRNSSRYHERKPVHKQ